jgi:beta-phosphoglucomutase
MNAILFDMDGVLTNTEPVINAAAIRGLHEYGVDSKPEDFEPFVGMGEDRYIGGVAEKYGVPYKLEMKARVYEIYLDILPEMIERFDGVHELLAAIRERKLKLGLATSADRIKMEANLKAIDVPLDWFDAIVTGEDIEHKKPDPEIYLNCAGKLGVDPGRCCVVEDAINGVQAAKAAGMRCIAVTTSFDRQKLAAAGADQVCDGLTEIDVEDFHG